MCEPVSLTTGLMIASSALTATGAVMQGVSTRNSMRYKAAMGERNAALDRAAARDALKRGEIENRRQQQRTAQRLGAQRAGLAASGLDVDFGSAGELQDDTRRMGWEDSQTVRENAMREARGYEISAWNRDAGAAADRATGSAAMWSAAMDAGGSLLTGAQQVRKSWALSSSSRPARAAAATSGGYNFAFPGPPGFPD